MYRLDNSATHLNITVTGYLIKETRYLVDMVKAYAEGCPCVSDYFGKSNTGGRTFGELISVAFFRELI